MWYVRPAKPQISLRIRAVLSEVLLVAWVFYDYLATDWTPFGISKLKRRLQRLVRVYTCPNVKLLEVLCHGSFSGDPQNIHKIVIPPPQKKYIYIYIFISLKPPKYQNSKFWPQKYRPSLHLYKISEYLLFHHHGIRTFAKSNGDFLNILG